ncbi:PTS system cellobiose-specific IIA component [Vibrio sp. ES.051]|uniref:PTS lactose/cellobiose transporter subunit IIA n=1 Tax=Vibrio sp. ES.051 TaxID=1761909 RepID=UPI000BF9DD4B|nr:PTS lactose/cellobiose transporter subunit IIA [Vibrio sp. ES.051]PFG58353.1 PTS system cellobiose-specific IIA component [Vibrio sp. ES.051]
MTHEIKKASDIDEAFLMTLLCEVGEARSLFMQALLEARQQNLELVQELLAQGDAVLTNVHKSQTSLIGFDEGIGKVQMTLILTHIQDHIMTTMLCRDLAIEIIELRKELKG